MVSTKRKPRPSVNTTPPPQRDLRQQILLAAYGLLSSGGTDAVTTRAVAEAAGVQTPALYRFFRDKMALLDALAEFGFHAYLASKPAAPLSGDPIEALRYGWDLHVEFGLKHPALYRLMYAEGHGANDAAIEVRRRVEHQISRIAASGRLRFDEVTAAQLLQSAACGVVFTLLALPEEKRDLSLSSIACDSTLSSISLDVPAVKMPSVMTLAVALGANLDSSTALSQMELGLLREWLSRIVSTAKRTE